MFDKLEWQRLTGDVLFMAITAIMPCEWKITRSSEQERSEIHRISFRSKNLLAPSFTFCTLFRKQRRGMEIRIEPWNQTAHSSPFHARIFHWKFLNSLVSTTPYHGEKPYISHIRDRSLELVFCFHFFSQTWPFTHATHIHDTYGYVHRPNQSRLKIRSPRNYLSCYRKFRKFRTRLQTRRK